ncbi:MAG: hypothetical protein K2H49_02440 [Muribaculaceae bacterium]|nr:hypothetical protein [Muribaculaceae bacterium]
MRKTALTLILGLTITTVMAQTKIKLTTGGKTITAVLADNQATEELKNLLSKKSIDIEMSDYGGFEKVGSLPQSFTTSNRQITTEPGDIMLYQGNNIVIFYGTNSWSYTPLGKIDGVSVSELRQFLGDGDITLTISLDTANGISEIDHESFKVNDKVYDPQGHLITQRPIPAGLYVINGKKTLIK